MTVRRDGHTKSAPDTVLEGAALILPKAKAYRPPTHGGRAQSQRHCQARTPTTIFAGFWIIQFLFCFVFFKGVQRKSAMAEGGYRNDAIVTKMDVIIYLYFTQLGHVTKSSRLTKLSSR